MYDPTPELTKGYQRLIDRINEGEIIGDVPALPSGFGVPKTDKTSISSTDGI